MSAYFLFSCMLVFFTWRQCQSAAPIFSGLPTERSVGELETTSRLIYILTVSDPDGDAFQCSVSATVPTSAFFECKKHTVLNKWTVYTKSPSFNDATAPQYVVTISCDDSNSTPRTAELTVKVVNNDLLAFTNMPVSTTSFDAMTTGAGTTLYIVAATSTLGSGLLTYTMTPMTDFSIDSSTGRVTNIDHLNRQISSPADLWVTVSDGTISVTDLLRINMNNLNNVPYFTNLVTPQTITIPEDTASGTLLFSLTSQDNDVGAALSYSYTVNPTTDAIKFSFSTNTLELRLASGQTFDFETRNFYNLTFTVDDTMASTTSILYINIQNANEPCYFDQSLYHVTTPEGSAGSGSVNPSFVVKDYDGTSTYSYSFMNFNNSNRFSIDASTGVITFAVNYDIDNSAMPALVYLTVICTDTTGETGTSQVEITITDVNDNAPSFATASSILTVNQYTAAGALIGSVLPTDADQGVNADVTCSGTSGVAAALSYYQVSSDCGVYLLQQPFGTIAYGTLYTLTVTATDNGNPQLSSTYTVDVLFRELTTTTATTTTTTNPYDLWDDPGAVAGISMAIILGTILSAVFLYFCIRCCYTGMCCGPDPCDFCNWCTRDACNCCQPRYRQNTRTITPQEYRKPRERADEFDYYDKNFDSDYESLKNEETRRPRVHNNSSRLSGLRSYPDFPQSQQSALSPSDGELVERPARILYSGRPLPIGYY